MKFIDFFAGIGGFRRGMELAGHECVGFCEFDKFATASYISMHLLTEEQRKTLKDIPIKKRQKEILKEEYRNGEWYANDIRRVYAGDISKADCWCFGFPCQDISVAGKQVGFQGNCSSLFFRVMYLVGQLKEEDKPTYLFVENVKNLLSVNGGWDFARLLIEMDRAGYDAEWQVLNSKDFGVPQNRERCFIIGHLRGRSTSKVFPVEGAIEKGIFTCYEIKSCKEDVYSGNGLNFIGEKNYLITTMECYKEILPDLKNGKFAQHIRENFPECYAEIGNMGVMVAVPYQRDAAEEFENPTPLGGDVEKWRLSVVLKCGNNGPRKRSMTELLFSMVRSGH